MPLYDFATNQTPRDNVSAQQLPPGTAEIPGVRQLSHAQGGRVPLDGSEFQNFPQHLEEFLTPGFRALDESMQQYWSGIRVPTRDSYRFMRVKIAGGDRSLMVWADALKEGRARLPLAAIDRAGVEFNKEKFSPAYHAMTGRYLGRRGDQYAKVFRPVPYLVNYTLIIWAERKRDAEFILYQILTRFNPLAEFRMFDGHVVGNVQLRFGGHTDASDKEAGHDQHANVRYEVTTVAEAWLPLPELIVPTVLGRVQVLQEQTGQILLFNQGSSAGAGGQAWVEPTQTVADAKKIIGAK